MKNKEYNKIIMDFYNISDAEMTKMVWDIVEKSTTKIGYSTGLYVLYQKTQLEEKNMIDMTKFFGDYTPTEKKDESGSSDYEELETLKPKFNLEYIIRLADPEVPAYKHTAESKFKEGEMHTAYVMDVFLIDIQPDKDSSCTKSAKYKLWIKEKHFKKFFNLWEKLGVAPDDRLISIEVTQVMGENGFYYHVWTFREV